MGVWPLRYDEGIAPLLRLGQDDRRKRHAAELRAVLLNIANNKQLNGVIVVNPPDSIADGVPVRIAAPQPEHAKGKVKST